MQGYNSVTMEYLQIINVVLIVNKAAHTHCGFSEVRAFEKI